MSLIPEFSHNGNVPVPFIVVVVTIVLARQIGSFIMPSHCDRVIVERDNDDTDNGEDDSDLRGELRHQHAHNEQEPAWGV